MFALALWLVAFVLLAREASADPFTPGSVVVLRANVSGEPGASLAAFLDEFTPTGDFLQTIDLPADNGPGLPAFSLSANDPYAGLMTRTSSREALLIVGYSVPAGTPKVEMSTSYITRRVVAIVWTNGTIDTSTLDVEEFGSDRKTPGFIRCAASDDMQDIWITGDSPNNPGGAVRISASAAVAESSPPFKGPPPLPPSPVPQSIVRRRRPAKSAPRPSSSAAATSRAARRTVTGCSRCQRRTAACTHWRTSTPSSPASQAQCSTPPSRLRTATSRLGRSRPVRGGEGGGGGGRELHTCPGCCRCRIPGPPWLCAGRRPCGAQAVDGEPH